MSSWSLADKLNTTNDQGGVDEVADYQPQQYAATLALLAANNENEVRELQRLAIERVAFDTGGGMCDNVALYPAWQKQRAGECVDRLKAAELFIRDGASGRVGPTESSVLHSPLPFVAGSLGPPASGYPSNQYSEGQALDYMPPRPPVGITLNRARLSTIPKKISNSVRGALYDMRHFKQIPKMRGGVRTDTLKYICTRDDRMTYLLLTLAFVFLAVSLVTCWCQRGGMQSHGFAAIPSAPALPK
jgi:hypothetical protein